ncbi:MAG: hypothetical protein PHH77_03580 [Victivallaceae bacterium]|nr:hypothetical protein [Victivallaceae bacterium]
MKKDEGSLELLRVYAHKYFPGRPQDTDCLAEAFFLENEFWEKMGKLLGG